MSESAYAIEIKNLSVEFSKYSALEDLNINVPENSFVTIVGPNGGGKSTLLKVLLGLIEPSHGSIRIQGKEPANLPANSIGYVPQLKTLDRTFPALPIELVATGIKNTWTGRINKINQKEAMQALEQVGAEHIAKRSLNKLSGGELQRVYLARSLVRKPKFLFLDEPVTGIDLVGEKDINNIIENYRKNTNTTIVMVTHDWEAAYHHADFVLLLNRKQICYEMPELAFSEHFLRQAFEHVGHKHEMMFGVNTNG